MEMPLNLYNSKINELIFNKYIRNTIDEKLKKKRENFSRLGISFSLQILTNWQLFFVCERLKLNREVQLFNRNFSAKNLNSLAIIKQKSGLHISI